MTRAFDRNAILAASTFIGVLCCITVVTANGGGHAGWADTVEGSSVLRKEIRQTGPFSSIRLRDSMDVTVTIGKDTQVSIEADDNLLKLIDTHVDGDLLVIESHGAYRSHHSARAQIQVPELRQVKLDGSGDIRIDGLHQGSLLLEIAGSGNIVAAGRVEQLDARIEGSGDLQLADLAAGTAKIRIDGSGDADASVSGSLDAVINGSGDIVYRGHPGQVDRRINGSGSIRNR